MYISQAVSILVHDAKSVLKLFCQYLNLNIIV